MSLWRKKNFILYSLIMAGLMELMNTSNSLPAFFGLWLFFYMLIHLFSAFGERLPMRILFLFFMCFQLLFTSYLAYFVYPDYQYYRMLVDPSRYFSYVVPAIIAFGIGLYWKEKKHQQLEAINLGEIKLMLQGNPGIAYFFITIGVIASFAVSVFKGSGIGFILYILSLLQFVGLFMVILGGIRLNKWLITSIYVSIVISSFRSAMFHDLIIWTIFLLAILALKYRPGFSKRLVIFIGAVICVLFIQVIKGTYRKNLQETDASIDVVINSAEQVTSEQGGLFSLSSVAPQISRFNQGWIVASVLDNVPRNEPFANGATIKLYLEAAFLPRVWAPDKLTAGDKVIFNKYSGRKILEGTSMALSSVSDAYINYGEAGGCVFMFVYGMLISFLMNFMSRKTKAYPFLPLFAMVIFAYAVRIECELQTIMGHLVKSSIILWVIFVVYQRALRRYFEPKRTPQLNTAPV